MHKYDVVRHPLYDQPECMELRRALFSVSDSDKAAVIVKYAIEHREPSALRTIDIFVKYIWFSCW